MTHLENRVFDRFQFSVMREASVCDVIIGDQLLSAAGAILDGYNCGSKIVVITNHTLRRHYLPILQDALRKSGYTVHAISLTPGAHSSKTLGNCRRIYDRLLEFGIDRGSTIVALGGGGVGDIAGFAAATYMRGIRFVQIPTSLLAQVDSSIGGKAAIHYKGIANLIGTYYQPFLILDDLSVLRTLPLREYRSGLAELLKTLFIGDKEAILRMLESNENNESLWGSLPNLISTCCKIKAGIVAQDETESKGIRWALNYGHTVGQAIEASSAFRYTHGEAVSLGIMAAAYVGEAVGAASELLTVAQQTLLRKVQLPTALSREYFPKAQSRREIVDTIVSMTLKDKKIREGKINFVVLEDFGNPKVIYGVDPSVIEMAVMKLVGE